VNSPPASRRQESHDARGGDTRGNKTNPKYVRIVNPVENGNPVIKRKVADHYVTTGRAEWVDADHLRLIASHPTNILKSYNSAAAYNAAAAVMIQSADELRHVPILRPRDLLTDRSVRASRHFRGRSGPARRLPK
jgi:hypothetical protein